MTPTGIKPCNNKVEGIIKLDELRTLQQLRWFIGMANYYHHFWPKQMHYMVPLTDLIKVSVKAFKRVWTSKCSEAFQAIKLLIARQVLLTFPNFNNIFVIEKDASDLQ